MAAAGVTALPGQVHGGTTLNHPRPAGGRLQKAAQLKPGRPGPLHTPAASSSPPAPCLRCGRHRGPAQALPRPRPVVAHALIGAARSRGHRPAAAHAPPPRVGGAAHALWRWRRARLGEGRGDGGVVALQSLAGSERAGERMGGCRLEVALSARSRDCHRAAGCGWRCPSPAVPLRAARGPQRSAVGPCAERGGGWQRIGVTRGSPPSVSVSPSVPAQRLSHEGGRTSWELLE